MIDFISTLLNALSPPLILAAFILVTSVSLTLYDKIAAIKRKRRIPEKALFLFATVGGALPMYITMLTISHKTKHKRFMIGLPFIIAAQITVFVALKRFL